MSRQAETELIDWTKWFYEHKDTDKSVQMQNEFLLKVIDGLFCITCQLANDIRGLEGRERVKNDDGEGNLVVIPGQKVRHVN